MTIEYKKGQLSNFTQYHECVSLYILSCLYPDRIDFEKVMRNRKDANIFPDFEVLDTAIEIGRCTDKEMSMENKIFNDISEAKSYEDFEKIQECIKKRGKDSEKIINESYLSMYGNTHCMGTRKRRDSEIIYTALTNIIEPKNNKLLKDKIKYSFKEYWLFIIYDQDFEDPDYLDYLREYAASNKLTYDKLFFRFLPNKVYILDCHTLEYQIVDHDPVNLNYVMKIWKNCDWCELNGNEKFIK